jgi:hypothetical protein
VTQKLAKLFGTSRQAKAFQLTLKKIDICKYKEILMATVKDALMIGWLPQRRKISIRGFLGEEEKDRSDR